MKIKALAAAVVMTMSSANVLADTYQFDLGANYTHADVDGFGSDGFFGAYARYYFSPVNTTNRPLAEAAFLGKSSNVTLSTAEDFDVVRLDAEVYIPNSIFYIGATATRTDYGNGSDNDWSARVGITPVDGLLITTSFNDDDYDLNLQAKYITALGGGNFLNVEGYFVDADSTNFFGVSADFYFDRTFSVGVAYEDIGDDVFTVRTRKFFTETFSGEVTYSKHEYFDVARVGVSVRF